MSTSGYFVFVRGDPVPWKSKKQSMVPLSSAESDYKVMSQSMCEIMWLYQLLVEAGIKTSVPTKLWCDNQATLHTNHVSMNELSTLR